MSSNKANTESKDSDAIRETTKVQSGKKHWLVWHLFRFLGWWFGFSGLYAMFAVCPFCGNTGCPVGAGSAGLVGGFMALCMQNWKTFFKFLNKRLKEKFNVFMRKV